MEVTHHYPEWGFFSPHRPPPEAFKDFKLHQEFNITGEFWRPSNENQKIPGQLFFIPGFGVRLLLNGSFQDWPKSKESFPVLNGGLAKGIPCTLLDAWGHVNTYGLEPCHYVAELFCKLLITGGIFYEDDDINISSMDVHLSHVDNWFNSPYELKINKEVTECLMCFQPDEARADILWKDKQCKIVAYCARTVPLRAGSNETKFSYAYRFHISSKGKCHYSWFFEVASILRECFLYLIGSGIYTLDMIATMDCEQKDLEGPRTKKYGFFIAVDVPS
jgi:hypothetical protein